ncbi:hypothetical protein EV217_3878 [Phyllobacterium myrsinacearum]|nr:hypothetical protein EV217_3878 [Phyllobacterium myrsinacearum]
MKSVSMAFIEQIGGSDNPCLNAKFGGCERWDHGLGKAFEACSSRAMKP